MEQSNLKITHSIDSLFSSYVETNEKGESYISFKNLEELKVKVEEFVHQEKENTLREFVEGKLELSADNFEGKQSEKVWKTYQEAINSPAI